QPTPAEHTATTSAALESFSVFSVLGRAMLGIAGAYLLRAAAQSSFLSIPVAAAIAILYAIVWLAFAAHKRAGAWFPATLYTATSALILAPLLWELTFRFQIFSAAGAAAVIALYIAAATFFAWRASVTPVFWVAYVAAVLIALSLFLACRSTTPFVSVLLFTFVLAAFTESSNRAPGLRNIPGLAASAAIWAAVYVYISPPASRSDYPILSSAALIVPAFILFTLYIASIVYNTVIRHQRISILEILQVVNTFLLLTVALDAFGPRSFLAFFGLLCLVLAAGGYAAVYLFFDRATTQRNYRVFSTWNVALVLTGCAFSLSTLLQSAAFSLLAVATTVLGTRFSRFALFIHGAIYLAAAAAVSGLAAGVFHSLAGMLPAAPPWPAYVAFSAAILCYVAIARTESRTWQQQTLQLLVAAIAIFAFAALFIHVLMGLAALRIQTGPYHLAFFRTFSLCTAALALAWAGPRFSRVELTRIANAALAMLAVKLVAEDLRHGHLAYIAASVFLFALTLIAVPRVARHARAPRSVPSVTGA
ncbi:MAG TPA: hypothetical protein VF730_04250, partial [Terracidiphilus sp.]